MGSIPASAGLLLTTLVFVILYAIEKHDSGRWPSWASFQQSRPASDSVDVSFSPEGSHHLKYLTPDMGHMSFKLACEPLILAYMVLPGLQAQGPPIHACVGALRSNIGINTDYRGRPREVLSEHGMVAADHGRCSEIGANLPQLPSSPACLIAVPGDSWQTVGNTAVAGRWAGVVQG